MKIEETKTQKHSVSFRVTNSYFCPGAYDARSE